MTTQEAKAAALGQRVEVRKLNGTVSRVNDDGTFSVKLDEPSNGATFLHRVRQGEVEFK
jgi:hypothetical protein